MALSLNIGKCTLLGNYRENNEDSIEVKLFPDLIVSIVADGMGGQNAGEVASKRAIEIIPRELRKNLTPSTNLEQTKTVLRNAIVQANEEIMAMGQLDKEMKNMGTTVVVALWRKGQELYVTGVGDSRTYLLRSRKIAQLTTDHSLAQALVEAKTISAAEARDHKFRNVLWKYLGSKEVGDGPEVTVVPITAADRFLLCSDGLHGVVPDEKLLQYCATQTDAQACADGLGQLALDSGSRDNVSCIIMDFNQAG
jgi:PPM family protein phosphatase